MALVDDALFALFPDADLGLSRAFEQRGRRTPAFETVSSATFKYEGRTEEIAKAVLDEQRREMLGQERQRMRQGVAEQLERASEGISFDFYSNTAAAGLEPVLSETPFGGHTQTATLGVGGGAGGRMGGRFRGRSARNELSGPPESPTAYWNASLITDPETGIAKVTVPLPAREARWRLAAHGVSADHRFGDAAATTVTSSPFVLDLMAPEVASIGDKLRVRAEFFAKEAPEVATAISFELRASRAGETQVLRTESTLPRGAGRARVTFPALDALSAGGADRAPLAIEVSAMFDGPNGDVQTLVARHEVFTRPAGYLVHKTAGGSTNDMAAFDLELEATERELALVLGRAPADWLIELARGARPGLWPLRMSGGCRVIPGAREHAASLLGVAHVLQAVGDAGGLDPRRLAALGQRADGLIAALVSAPNAAAGWSARRGGSIDAETTARGLVGLLEAQRAGRTVPSQLLDNVAAVLQTALSSERNDRRRAWILWALAKSGRTDDLALGRMHRERARPRSPRRRRPGVRSRRREQGAHGARSGRSRDGLRCECGHRSR